MKLFGSLTSRLTIFVSLAVFFGVGFAWPFIVIVRGVIFPYADWSIADLAMPDAEDSVLYSMRRRSDGSAYFEMTPALRSSLAGMPGFRFVAFDDSTGSPIEGSDPQLLAQIMPNERRHSIPNKAHVPGDPNPAPTFFVTAADSPIGSVVVVLYGFAFRWENLPRYLCRQVVMFDALGAAPALFLTVFVTWIVVRRGLAPLDAAGRNLVQIDLDALDQRVPLDGVPGEIAPFVTAVNHTLARLERGVDQQKRFVANAAHELRTPVAALWARVENPIDDNWRRDLRGCLRQMRAITEQLLASAKISAQQDKGDGAFETLDLSEIAEEKASDYLPLALEHGKSIEFEAPPRAVKVKAELHALESILTNLIDNALRAEPAGGAVLLRVSSDAVLEVIDHGEGVAPDFREQIFEPFWRKGDSAFGAGLGLAITKDLVEKLDGRVWVETTPGGGATFKVLLPKFPSN